MNRWHTQSRAVSDNALVVKDSDFNEICCIRESKDRTYGDQDEQDLRIASLISAAPELLIALQWATLFVQGYYDLDPDAHTEVSKQKLAECYAAMSTAWRK